MTVVKIQPDSVFFVIGINFQTFLTPLKIMLPYISVSMIISIGLGSQYKLGQLSYIFSYQVPFEDYLLIEI